MGQFLAEFVNEFLTDFVQALRRDKADVAILAPGKLESVQKVLRDFVGQDKYGCRDYDVYHKYVTKRVFDTGWGMLYLPLAMNIFSDAGQELQELRMENLKWIIVNYQWVSAIYPESVFYDFAERYAALGDLVESEYPEENVLREKLFELVGYRA